MGMCTGWCVRNGVPDIFFECEILCKAARYEISTASSDAKEISRLTESRVCHQYLSAPFIQ